MTAPLHERIRADYEARILSGDLAPGDRLPTEAELVQAYGCSRMTVSRALSALAAAGLIDRRKRAGTFVARPRVHSMVLDIPDLAAEVADRGQTYAYRSLARGRCDAADADELAGAASGPLMRFDGLHLADGVPLAIEHRLVSIAAVPDIADAVSDGESPGSWLLRHVPWTEAESRISAAAASDADARHLHLPTGTACLCVDRRTWRGGEWVTVVRQLFPGDAYDLVARFGPGGGRDPI